ncbi:MAG: hypothetical protein ABIJ86_06480 [Spirochaetota bacterium]
MNKLPWFKHDHNARNDDFLQRAEDKFGHFGYSAYFKLLELLHQHGTGDELRMTPARLCRELRSRRAQVRLYLDFSQGSGKVQATWKPDEVRLQIKNFRKKQEKCGRKNPPKPPLEGEGEEEGEEEGDREEKTLALSPADSEPPVIILTFPIVGRGSKEWHLIESKLREYKESYPGIDVMAECRKALQWCRDIPAKRKTAQGMPKFLNGWLGRSQNNGARGGRNAGTAKRDVGHAAPKPGKYSHLDDSGVLPGV